MLLQGPAASLRLKLGLPYGYDHVRTCAHLIAQEPGMPAIRQQIRDEKQRIQLYIAHVYVAAPAARRMTRSRTPPSGEPPCGAPAANPPALIPRACRLPLPAAASCPAAAAAAAASVAAGRPEAVPAAAAAAAAVVQPLLHQSVLPRLLRQPRCHGSHGLRSQAGHPGQSPSPPWAGTSMALPVACVSEPSIPPARGYYIWRSVRQ